jgi:endonuclease/exonuclease/phosphatase (EEP) superfamily protein YafD
MALRIRLSDRWRRILTAALATGAVASSAPILFARQVWFGELVASFEWQVGWTLAAAALSLALLRARRIALAVALLALVHVAPDLRLWLPREESASAAGAAPQRLRLASANVLQPNRHHAEIGAALAATDADVIGVLELSLEMRTVLERELSAWPHRAFAPTREPWSSSTWGIALFSKRPLHDVRFVQLIECYAPLIEARVESAAGADSQRLTLRLVHLPRPGSKWRVEVRNEALAQLASQFEWGPHTVVFGDLNTTSSSPAFGDLLERTALADSRQGFGRQSSWWLRSAPNLRRAGAPAWLAQGLGVRLGIAIDHVLTGAGLVAEERAVFELPFSDHGGVLADFSVRSARP